MGEGANSLPPVGPWLRALAHFLPYRTGLFEKHLRLMRAGMVLTGRLTARRDVEVDQRGHETGRNVGQLELRVRFGCLTGWCACRVGR
jgi:hypothetical protein